MTAGRIVKLVPYGQPEDHLFEEVVVGGSDDLSQLADFVGWHLERFTGSTDGSGNLTVVLANAPTDIDHVFVFSHEDERVVRPTALASSTHLTVHKRKLIYDKANGTVGGASSAPAGVTVAGTSGQSTSTVTTTESGSVTLNGDAAAFSGTGSGNALRTAQSHSHTHNSHSHTFNVLYDHAHSITSSPTSLAAAASEATALLVLYR